MDTAERFITMVELESGLGRAEAERAARATIDAFFERLSGGEARDLAQHLPTDLVRPARVLPDRAAETFDLGEFLRRVAELEDTDTDTAARHAEAVLTALRVVVGPKEYAEAVAQLPADYEALIAETQRPHVEVHSLVEFVARVQRRAGIDGGHARRAIDAVLETLAERIAEGEVARLVAQLPGQLRAALEKGAAQTTATRRLPVGKFVGLVAEREDATPEQAHEHTRAVLATVADTIGEQDFYETVVRQLPNDYAELLAPR
jgi:uncharacterized protein (DUF2267 family)